MIVTNVQNIIAVGELSMGEYPYWYRVDAIGVVHTANLRIQALMLPVQMLVFGGH